MPFYVQIKLIHYVTQNSQKRIKHLRIPQDKELHIPQDKDTAYLISYILISEES